VVGPQKIPQLESMGVREGRTCDAGEGRGRSIATWLGRQVGPSARVVAIDVDARLFELPWSSVSNLEVRRSDITAPPVEPEAIVLVLARPLIERVSAGVPRYTNLSLRSTPVECC
jgi:hypothetical protein